MSANRHTRRAAAARGRVYHAVFFHEFLVPILRS